jgi:hypothetical protein
MCLGNKWPKVVACICIVAELQFFHFLSQLINELLGAAFGSSGERCMALSVAVAIGDEVAVVVIDKPLSISASGIIIAWFFAPPNAWQRLPVDVAVR